MYIPHHELIYLPLSFVCALWWLYSCTVTYCLVFISNDYFSMSTKQHDGHRTTQSTCIKIEHWKSTIFLCAHTQKMLIHKIFMKNPLFIYWLCALSQSSYYYTHAETRKLCQYVINWLCARLLLHSAHMPVIQKNMFSH